MSRIKSQPTAASPVSVCMTSRQHVTVVKASSTCSLSRPAALTCVVTSNNGSHDNNLNLHSGNTSVTGNYANKREKSTGVRLKDDKAAFESDAGPDAANRDLEKCLVTINQSGKLSESKTCLNTASALTGSDRTNTSAVTLPIVYIVKSPNQITSGKPMTRLVSNVKDVSGPVVCALGTQGSTMKPYTLQTVTLPNHGTFLTNTTKTSELAATSLQYVNSSPNSQLVLSTKSCSAPSLVLCSKVDECDTESTASKNSTEPLQGKMEQISSLPNSATYSDLALTYGYLDSKATTTKENNSQIIQQDTDLNADVSLSQPSESGHLCKISIEPAIACPFDDSEGQILDEERDSSSMESPGAIIKGGNVTVEMCHDSQQPMSLVAESLDSSCSDLLTLNGVQYLQEVEGYGPEVIAEETEVVAAETEFALVDSEHTIMEGAELGLQNASNEEIDEDTLVVASGTSFTGPITGSECFVDSFSGSMQPEDKRDLGTMIVTDGEGHRQGREISLDTDQETDLPQMTVIFQEQILDATTGQGPSSISLTSDPTSHMTQNVMMEQLPETSGGNLMITVEGIEAVGSSGAMTILPQVDRLTDRLTHRLTDRLTDPSLKEELKKARDREKKRAQRADPNYREKERERSVLRMRNRRQDLMYRQNERTQDRIRRKVSRQQNHEMRAVEKERDKISKRIRRLKLLQIPLPLMGDIGDGLERAPPEDHGAGMELGGEVVMETNALGFHVDDGNVMEVYGEMEVKSEHCDDGYS